MFRAPDVWDEPAQKKEAPKAGYSDGFAAKYTRTPKRLGKGGFGEVFVCTSNATGTEYACKSISKVLDVPNISEVRLAQHINNIKQEVSVLRKLRGTLNVVYLEDVFEDATHVHIVMELCRGGELLAKVSTRHYSERTVASYMRAVLRTLAQCHHHRILHRDIKPGNFMLLTDAEDAPVKAIDFGLAVFFDPKALPVRNLGLEGTPHYMAPESLSSEIYPASDVWAAGVMAYQLLSGRFPFDDWKNLKNPALSKLWKSILTEEPKFTGSAWEDVSDGAKDFIRQLLNKDPKTRPSAQQALAHPWLEGKIKQRVQGKPLASTIVQRLQRFSTNNAFKRTVLDMIANELLLQHLQQQQQQHKLQQQQLQKQQPLQAPAAATVAVPQPKTLSRMAQSASVGTLSSVSPGELSPGSAGHPAALNMMLSKDGIPDVSNPQLRSLAACSFIRSLQDKAATVHAGTLARGAMNYGSRSHRSTGSVHGGGSPGHTILAPGVIIKPSFQSPPPGSPLAQEPVPPAPQAIPGNTTPAPQPSEELLLIANLPMPGYAGSAPVHGVATSLAAADSPITSIDGGQVLPGSPLNLSQVPTARNKHYASFHPDASRGVDHGSRGVPAAPSSRMARQMDGSGHNLQHYSFLLAAGERSLHGLANRSIMQRSGSQMNLHPTGTGYPHSNDGPGSATGQPPQPGALQYGTAAQQATPTGGDWLNPQPAAGGMPGLAQSPPAQQAYTVHGMSDVKRLLQTVQRQRKEHKKLQRLMLDTSGHSLSLYEQVQQQQQAEAAAAEAAQGGLAKPGAELVVGPLGAGAVDSPQAPPASGPLPGRTLVEGEAGLGDDSTTEDSTVEGEDGIKSKRRKGLLHQVGSALMKPVKDLFDKSGRRQSSSGPSTPARTSVSGAPKIPGSSDGDSPLRGPSEPRGRPTSSLTQALARSANGVERKSASVGTWDRESGGGQERGPRRRSIDAVINSPDAVEEVPGSGQGEGSQLEAGRRGQGAYAALVSQLPGADSPRLIGRISAPMLVGGPQSVMGQALPPSGDATPLAAGSSPALHPTFASIHTVKAHKAKAALPGTEDTAAGSGERLPKVVDESHTIAAQLARIESQRGPKDSVDPSGDGTAERHQQRVGGTVSRGTVYNALGNLLGGPAQLAEFQAVLAKLKYDENSELSFEEISEGLKMLGYHLEANEVETLLSEVALGGDHISQGQFLASQVDWRQFQANHREEWLACLRKAFDGLARDTDGRIGEDQIVALLRAKLPEDEVNMAVQETLLDAAVLGAEGLDFEDFARMLAADSESDFSLMGDYPHPGENALYSRSPSGANLAHDGMGLMRSMSLDLYDPRLDTAQNPSMRGRTDGASPAAASGAVVGSPLPPSWLAGQLEHGSVHGGMHGLYYAPGLPTVMDDDE